MLGVPNNAAFIKFLADGVKKGVLRRVTKGLYESALTPPAAEMALYLAVKKLRMGVLNYISLESQLSYTGDISQIMLDRLTVITKGRSDTFETPYGVIELIHTKKAIDTLVPHLYFDAEIKMYRASTEQAKADLRHCRRNLHMLES